MGTEALADTPTPGVCALTPAVAETAAPLADVGADAVVAAVCTDCDAVWGCTVLVSTTVVDPPGSVAMV